MFPSNTSQSEVHISLDVNNPSHLLISANTIYQQGWYFSGDAGETWTGSNNLPFYSTVDGDPSTAFSSTGNLFVSTIAPNANGYLLYKSSDQGQNWTVYRGDSTGYNNFDKEMIACDNTPNSPYKDNLYCVWTEFNSDYSFRGVMFNRSSDGGSTFSQPIFLENGPGQGANVQTGPNGDVYVCWANFETGNRPANGIGFTKSVNGGVSFQPSSIIFPYTGISYTNKGDTAFNNIRVNDFPSMAVDKSNGPYRGRVYIAYPAKENNSGKAIIQVRYSDNEGSTWSSPYTVSISNGRQNFFPWIAVDDSTGTVCVVYYSFDSPSGWSTNTYMAYSKDGAKWYNMKVSDVSHITAPINNSIYNSGYEGDYIGVAAYGGKAYPAWMDDRNGTWQIYVSPVHFIFASISGDSTVCTSGSTFTLNNPPPNVTVNWTQSNNLTYVSGQGTDNYVVKATTWASDSGWVQASISGDFGNINIRKDDFWVGNPGQPITDPSGYPTYQMTLGQIKTIRVVSAPGNPYQYVWNITGSITKLSGGGTQCTVEATTTGLGNFYVNSINTCGTSVTGGGSVNVSSGGGGGILLSPNPVNNILTIEINNKNTPDNLNNINSKTSELRVYDKMMNLKMKKTFKGVKTKINVRNLKQGVYILQIISGNKNYKKEIMVSHH